MNTLDDEFKYFITNMSCVSVVQNPFSDRCTLIKNVPDCDRIVNWFNYFEIVYCYLHITDKSTEVFVMLVLILLVFFYVLLMSIVVSLFCSPVLKILSVKMHMNEYLAGITLLTIGNTLPDLIGNLLPVRDESAIIACSFSSALTILLLCGGMVLYVKPFKIDGYSIIRDLLFFLLTVEYLFDTVLNGSSVTTLECCFLICICVVYVAVNVVDLILVKSRLKNLYKKIEYLRGKTLSTTRNKELEELIHYVQDLENHEKMDIHKKNANYYIPDARYSKLQTGFKSRSERTQNVNMEVTRTQLYNPKNSKNKFLFKDFLNSLNPINAYDWKTSGNMARIGIIITSPVILLASLFVPMVNYECSKHGWCKLLNCLQLISDPFLIITIACSLYQHDISSWRPTLQFYYSKWSPVFTVPLAIIIFMNSRTDVPPSYHYFFIILNVVSSLCLITFCCAEIQVLTTLIGVVFKLGGDFVDITFGSILSAILDLVTTYAATMQGYERMAFAAIIAGSIYTLSGCGIAMLLNDKIRLRGSTDWLIGHHGDNGYVFIFMAIAITFFWSLTFNFYARRSMAIFYWLLFIIFMTYASLIEFDIIHSFKSDPLIDIV